MIDALRRLFGLAPDDRAFGVPRSPRWPAVRARHLAAYPACEACGGREHLEVHHVVPVHVDRGRELDPANLLVLCEKPAHDCHYVHGHLLSWAAFNPAAVADAAAYLAKVRSRPTALTEAP